MAFYHPVLFRLDAERAHTLTIAALGAWGKAGAPLAPSVPRLTTTVAGIAFPNPVGLAAGVDKDGRAIDGFFGLGFGSVEIGTLTPLAQPGNPKPRIFRLPEDRSIINRLGFNNGGLDGALPRAQSAQRNGVLGINVGANKDATDRTADYVHGVTRAAPHADYITINISSPNTPGLRDLQHGAALRDLLAACTAAKGTTPIFLKVAPDLEPADIDDIARAALDNRIDALIVNNTTISRPGLRSANAQETGGLSGAPLVPLARERLSDFRKATGAAIPLISVGGVDSGAEAYARLRAGASLVQLYTALVYEGPGLPARILRELDALLTRDGFTSVGDAVGVDAR
ncbi:MULTISPECIES: quinone-dependent dihydroorotate dehydrogenase [unclassified Sphingomonas]|uniref:quinone-dependent dihydroorotate dehydrogenase n=1 Tax=unclassified Sphingomonas TaxID=196159 RepID=UPI000E73082D|nr:MULTISPECIES: quinone-dependent dihydroorotate dehydrogenase [unclassified Sphingomonas]RKE49880.1 dihydroorotate oxidase A [Sphingomonas sp. PP-CC-1A-547]TCM08210.1 dihydroorotate oxidase A [Sphingomonas sp. PP-CC-3G-468]